MANLSKEGPESEHVYSTSKVEALPDESHFTDKVVYEVEGENAELAAALAIDKPHPFSKTMITLYLVCFVGYLNSCINGYDGSLMGGINAMTQYLDDFHMKNKGATTGITFAIYSLAQLAGSFAAGPAADRWGRRVGMAIGSFIILVGTAAQASAQQRSGFLGGRFTVGFGVAIVTSAAPAYVVEMAHPAYRGAMTGGYNICYYIGSIIASWVMYGTNLIDGTAAWRIPVGLQALPSLIVFSLVWFLPESPRWLISAGRREDAKKVLIKYHGNNNPESNLVKLEIQEIDENISRSGSDKRWWDYRDLCNTRNARYRSLIVITMAFFGQWSGNGVVTYFFPVFLEGAGITSSQRQLLFNAIQPMLSFFAALAGIFVVDKRGRRPTILYVTLALPIMWAIIAGTSSAFVKSSNSSTPNKSAANASIAFVYLFQMVFSFGYTPMQALYTVECLKFEARAKGMGMNAFFVNIAGFVNQYGISVGIEKIAWKFYLVYVGWDIIEACVIYFLWPETKGRTLEELDEIFDAQSPVRESLRKRKLAVGESGQYVVTKQIETSRVAV